MDRLELYFLPTTLNVTDKNYRLGRLQIKFLLTSIAFAIGYWVNTYFTEFIAARYVMIFNLVFFVGQLFAFKSGVSLRITSHVFIFICWLVIFTLTLFSGGIQSYVLGWVLIIPIISLILLSYTIAWFWGLIGFFTVVFFYTTQPTEFLPPNLIFVTNNLLIASLHIGLLFLLLTLIYIFYKQQNLLISTIESQNEILKSSKEEIAAQNEELSQSQEEILAQRDVVALQNYSLEEARRIIEKQNEALTLKNEGLEIEIKKRTAELVEYNQQLEQFAFMSSHNLRAPIARILGLSNVLEITKDEHDEIMIRKSLIVSARELDRVVKDLTTILEIRKSNTSILVDIDLREELNLILINLEKEIAETKTTILSDFTEAYLIRTIRPYLDSILINLISNAIKYRHENRTPEIQIKTELVDEYFCLTIKDNGLGIDLAKHKDKLFTLYSRFHHHVEGKGLGLYLVKIQAESLGGKVEVASDLNSGTTFTIYFKQKM
jgi:signal transduction histidine kinase